MGRHHAHGLIVAAQQVADHTFNPMRALRGGPQGQVVGSGIITCDDTPAFDGMGAAPVQSKGFPDGNLRVSERSVNVAIVKFELGCQVVGQIPVGGRAI